jgi:hypothetical protein
MPVEAHYAKRWKPVQARCGAKKVEKVKSDGKQQNVSVCRELVDLEPREGSLTIWEGVCKCGAKKVNDMNAEKAA